MAQTFPRKQPGDKLSAAHINSITDVARRAAVNSTGSHQAGLRSTFQGVANPPPHREETFEITANLRTTLGEEYDGIYEIQPRYLIPDNARDDQWQTNTDAGPFRMDAKDLGLGYVV